MISFNKNYDREGEREREREGEKQWGYVMLINKRCVIYCYLLHEKYIYIKMKKSI